MLGPLSVEVHLFNRMDVDNIQKPLLDAMEKARIFENDRQVVKLLSFKHKARPEFSHILVEIETVDDVLAFVPSEATIEAWGRATVA